MNRRVLGVLVHAAAGFIAGCTPTTPQPSSGASAPSPTFLLSGKVADAAIVPIPGALVTIVGAGGTESSTLTDGDGRYELRGLPGGAARGRRCYFARQFHARIGPCMPAPWRFS